MLHSKDSRSRILITLCMQGRISSTIKTPNYRLSSRPVVKSDPAEAKYDHSRWTQTAAFINCTRTRRLSLNTKKVAPKREERKKCIRMDPPRGRKGAWTLWMSRVSDSLKSGTPPLMSSPTMRPPTFQSIIAFWNSQIYPWPDSTLDLSRANSVFSQQAWTNQPATPKVSKTSTTRAVQN